MASYVVDDCEKVGRLIDCLCNSTIGARASARWLAALLRCGYEVHNGFDNDEAGHAAARAMQRADPPIHRLTPPV